MTLTLTIIIGIATSLIASIIYGTAGGGYRRWFGQQIKITNPQENGYLGPVEVRRGTNAHPVSGTLKYLPKDHQIWLVVVNDTTGKCWPQGFERVDYDAKAGTWKGYVTAEGWHNVTIVAVVAPQTTQEYFKYFQRVGSLTKHEGLLAIPHECKRRDTVHVRLAPASVQTA